VHPVFSDTIISRIVELYKLPPVKHTNGLDSGYESNNVKLEFADAPALVIKHWVLVNRTEAVESHEWRMKTYNYLYDHGIPCPRCLERIAITEDLGTMLTFLEEKYFSVHTYLEGREMTEDEADTMMEFLAIQIALLHKKLASVPLTVRPREAFLETNFSLHSNYPLDKLLSCKLIIPEDAQYVEEEFTRWKLYYHNTIEPLRNSKRLKIHIIHGDIAPFVWKINDKNEIIGLLDIGCEPDYPQMDLAGWTMYCGLVKNSHTFKLFFDSYVKTMGDKDCVLELPFFYWTRAIFQCYQHADKLCVENMQGCRSVESVLRGWTDGVGMLRKNVGMFRQLCKELLQ